MTVLEAICGCSGKRLTVISGPESWSFECRWNVVMHGDQAASRNWLAQVKTRVRSNVVVEQ